MTTVFRPAMQGDTDAVLRCVRIFRRVLSQRNDFARAFCPSGEGGGIDNSCGGEGGGGSPDWSAAKKGAKSAFTKGEAKQTLSKAAASGVKDYSHSHSGDVNELLRGGDSAVAGLTRGRKEAERVIAELDKGFAEAAPLENDMVVMRVGLLPSGTKEFTDAGFVSTTTDKAVVKLIRESIPDRARRKALQDFSVRIPKGTKVLFIKQGWNDRKESEVLLPRGTTFVQVDSTTWAVKP